MNSKSVQLRSHLARTSVLILIGMCAGIVVNEVRSAPLDWNRSWGISVEEQWPKSIESVSLDEVLVIVKTGSHVVLDARPRSQYQEGHLPGAFSLPVDDLDRALSEVASQLAVDVPIVVYCSSAACSDGLRLTELLREQGMAEVVLFTGGYEEWVKAGEEVETGW